MMYITVPHKKYLPPPTTTFHPQHQTTSSPHGCLIHQVVTNLTAPTIDHIPPPLLLLLLSNTDFSLFPHATHQKMSLIRKEEDEKSCW
jgi:hypothetical protein